MKAKIFQSVKMPKAKNKVYVLIESHIFGISRRYLKRFAEKVLKDLKFRNTILSLVFVSDSTMKRLNQKHLHHSYTTDVLAFPFSSFEHTSKRPRFLGEVIVSPERARVQAKIFKAAFREELLRYVCHGILHLAGYSDKSKRRQKRMRLEEDKLLQNLLT